MKKHLTTQIICCLFLLNFSFADCQELPEIIHRNADKNKPSDNTHPGTGRRKELRELHLSRFFSDCSLFGVSEFGVNQYNEMMRTSQFVGTQFRIGNNWHLLAGDFRGILRLTWIRVAFAAGDDGALFSFAPLHLGLGHNFRVSDRFSIELMASGGLLIIGPGFMNDYVELNYGIVPELKFNIKNMVIGLEYSFKSDRFDLNYHYYALGFGFRF